uniref:Uncharacterized protein n=1 Tax=Physcomitrium patens TaxID=3218 RepID=A0A2K1KQP5_PHYPA|nr:hypothetical protein PHYPA_006992 [Physcomitrium patens]
MDFRSFDTRGQVVAVAPKAVLWIFGIFDPTHSFGETRWRVGREGYSKQSLFLRLDSKANFLRGYLDLFYPSRGEESSFRQSELCCFQLMAREM